MYKTTINSTDLKAITGKLGKIIQKNSITSIMESCLMNIDNGRARFIGLDMGYAIESTVPAIHGDAFAVAIHFAELDDAAGSVPPDVPMEFSIEGKGKEDATVTIKCGRDEFIIPGTQSHLFPKLPQADDAIKYVMDANFVADFTTARKFQSGPADLPSFHGSLVQFKDQKARMYATDRSTMFRSDTYDADGVPDSQVMMPPKTADMLGILKGDGAIALEFGEGSWGTLSTETTRIYCRLIEDNAPPYDLVLGKDVPGGFTFDVNAMMRSIRAACVGVNGCKDRTLLFTVSGDSLQIESASNEKSKKATTQLEIQSEGSPSFTIKFSPEALNTCIGNLSGTGTARHGNNNERHFLFSDESGDAVYLAMPLK